MLNIICYMALKTHCRRHRIYCSSSGPLKIIKNITSIIPMYSKNLFYIDVTVGLVHQRALVDTGACNSAMSKSHLAKILSGDKNSIKKREEIPNDFVRVANGHHVKIHEYVNIELDVCGSKIVETFMIFSALHSVILGAPFFKNNQITIDLAVNHSRPGHHVATEPDYAT